MKQSIVKVLAVIVILAAYNIAWDYFFHSKQPTEKLVESNAAHKPRFIVLAYSQKGKITHDILCDEVREDQVHKQVVCRCADTGELYIFPYPVMVKDVTYTADFINYNKTLR